jgi:hypothetical protein
LALTTYANLKTAIADWLERDDLSARIGDFITLAEAHINRTLRVRQMVRRSQATITDAYSAAPPDLAEVIALTLDGAALEPTPLGVLGTGPEMGRPRRFAQVGPEIRYWPAPDRAYVADLTYYARTPALSDEAPTNWLLAEAPDVYLYGALLQAAPYLHDAESASTWGQLYAAALGALREAQRTLVGGLRTEIADVLSIQDRFEGGA